jgi:hypothetical protein
MKLNPFSYFQHAIVAPLGVGLTSSVDTDNGSPLPPAGSQFRVLTTTTIKRRLTTGELRITDSVLT